MALMDNTMHLEKPIIASVSRRKPSMNRSMFSELELAAANEDDGARPRDEGENTPYNTDNSNNTVTQSKAISTTTTTTTKKRNQSGLKDIPATKHVAFKLERDDHEGKTDSSSSRSTTIVPSGKKAIRENNANETIRRLKGRVAHLENMVALLNRGASFPTGARGASGVVKLEPLQHMRPCSYCHTTLVLPKFARMLDVPLTMDEALAQRHRMTRCARERGVSKRAANDAARGIVPLFELLNQVGGRTL